MSNLKSQDVSLQPDHGCSLAIDSGVLKLVTRLAWEQIPNAFILVGASHSYPFIFAFIMRSWIYLNRRLHAIQCLLHAIASHAYTYLII